MVHHGKVTIKSDHPAAEAIAAPMLLGGNAYGLELESCGRVTRRANLAGARVGRCAQPGFDLKKYGDSFILFGTF